MIKKSTILGVACLTAAAIFVTPRTLQLKTNISEIQQMNKQSGDMKKNLSLVDKELAGYKEKYKDVKLQSNVDLAQVIVGLGGVKFISVTSIAEMDGEMVNCSEVTKIEDISFFSSQTKQMRFKLQAQNFDEFRRSLADSAVAVRSLEYSRRDNVIYLVVDTIFDSVTVPTEGVPK